MSWTWKLWDPFPHSEVKPSIIHRFEGKILLVHWDYCNWCKWSCLIMDTWHVAADTRHGGHQEARTWAVFNCEHWLPRMVTWETQWTLSDSIFQRCHYHLSLILQYKTYNLPASASLSAVHCTWCRVALLKISCYDLSLVTGCHTDPAKSSTRAPPPVCDNTATCVYPRLLFAPLQHYISTDTPVSGGECRMCQAELVITLFILTYPLIQLLGHFLHTTNTTIPKADYTTHYR